MNLKTDNWLKRSLHEFIFYWTFDVAFEANCRKYIRIHFMWFKIIYSEIYVRVIVTFVP